MNKSNQNLSNLCIHTITTKPWFFQEACENYGKAGVGGITIWSDAIQNMSLKDVNQIIMDNNLNVVSYCRGGFFASTDKLKRSEAIEQNKQMIDTAAGIGAPLLVLVCGADPEQSLETSRSQIRDGIEAILPLAQSHNIRLGIEPLHPMYADTRSAINTLRQANDMAMQIKSKFVGVVVDVYHLWWDPDLKLEIKRSGQNNSLFAYHISDWKTPTTDLLLDRGIMGEGCIPLQEIGKWVQEAGFEGYEEVEIFSKNYWKKNQHEFLDQILNAYQDLIRDRK